MIWTITAKNSGRVMLRYAMLLGLVSLLIFSSIVWAGPMGDPEPGQNSPAAPQGTSPDSLEGDDIYSSISLYLQLALLLSGLQL